MFGPIEGKRHDAFMLGVSGLSNKLNRLQEPNEEPYVIHGDPAYGAQINDDQQEFNSKMSKLRVCVEWGFGKICQLFAFFDFKKNLKILLQPIGKHFLVATLLTNCHTCLYGSQTGKFFELDPPTLESYLSNN